MTASILKYTLIQHRHNGTAYALVLFMLDEDDAVGLFADIAVDDFRGLMSPKQPRFFEGKKL